MCLLQNNLCALLFIPFVAKALNTDVRIRPLSFPLQGFMRLVPSIVKIGPPEFCGLLNEIAPHPNIRKLRGNDGVCEGTGRDIISVMSE